MSTPGGSGALVGVYGGTFNPIHLGHLRAAEEVVEALGLDSMLFVPSARPPHKSATPTDVIAPAELRLGWVRDAIADNARFEVDTIEIDRDGPSYLVETLRALGKRLAPELPVFTVGRDAFEELGSWREPETLLALAHFAVTTRPPVAEGSLANWIPEALRADVELDPGGSSGRHRKAGSWIRLVPVTPLDISASDVRARLRDGRSVRYLLPESIADSVVASGVYACGKESAAGKGVGEKIA